MQSECVAPEQPHADAHAEASQEAVAYNSALGLMRWITVGSHTHTLPQPLLLLRRGGTRGLFLGMPCQRGDPRCLDTQT